MEETEQVVTEIRKTARRRIPFTFEIKTEYLQTPDALERVWITLPNGMKSRFVRATHADCTNPVPSSEVITAPQKFQTSSKNCLLLC